MRCCNGAPRRALSVGVGNEPSRPVGDSSRQALAVTGGGQAVAASVATLKPEDAKA